MLTSGLDDLLGGKALGKQPDNLPLAACDRIGALTVALFEFCELQMRSESLLFHTLSIHPDLVSHLDDPRFPATRAILGSDDAKGEYFMLTFDTRGVSRKHNASLHDGVWKWWRDAPNFSQRYQATIADDGNTLIGKGELCKDGTTWEKDLDLTYTREE